MSDRYEVRLSGEGGQGLVLAGIILAEAAIADGRNAVQTQAYGPESRGGASRSDVIISDGEIDYPKATRLDLLLALSQQGCDNYLRDVRPGGLVLVDRDKVLAVPPGRYSVVALPILAAARERAGRALVANIVSLAAIAALSKAVSPGALERAVLARVPRGTEELNRRALEVGYALLREGHEPTPPLSEEEDEAMRSREAVFQVLHEHFGQVADPALLRRVAGEVAGLPDEWEELPETFWTELGSHLSVQCADICSLAAEAERGAELRIFRRRAG
jgi:2-oxoglutarate ferredoxin oxidoreductase subunit gamma